MPFHAYPVPDDYTLHNGIVTWHFSICLSFISIGLLGLGLLLSAQLCCHTPWAFERKFLIIFHSFMLVNYAAVIIILVMGSTFFVRFVWFCNYGQLITKKAVNWISFFGCKMAYSSTSVVILFDGNRIDTYIV